LELSALAWRHRTPDKAIQLPGVRASLLAIFTMAATSWAREIVGKPIRTTRRYKELLDDKRN